MNTNIISTSDTVAGMETITTELQQHLESLHEALAIECDLHGSRTQMAYNIRMNIIATEKELTHPTTTKETNQ